MARVLFVTDDPNHVPASQTLLEKEGYRVTSAVLDPEDAGSAHDFVDNVLKRTTTPFDAVVIQEQTNLGAGSSSPGIELIKKLRGPKFDSIDFDPEAPVMHADTPILVRGVNERDKDMFRAAGADWVHTAQETTRQMAQDDQQVMAPVIEELGKQLAKKGAGTDAPGNGPKVEEHHHLDTRRTTRGN